MKVIIEEMCANITELFGAAVIFAALGGMIVTFRNFSDSFIGCFLG